MKHKKYIIAISVFLLMPFSMFAQQRTPKIGYVYPAGGQKGTTITVGVAGQFLRQMREAHISGEGVNISVVTNMPSFPNNLNRERRYMFLDLAMDTMLTRFEESGCSSETIDEIEGEFRKQWPWQSLNNTNDLQLEGEKIPDHILLMDFEKKSIREVMHVKNYFFLPYKYKQINRQLAEMVVLKIEIASDAEPGDRKLWLSSKKEGASNPVIFQIGNAPETRELELNNAKPFEHPWFMNDHREHFNGKPETVPFVMNGQIMPGDTDRFRFKAKKGQNLLIEAEARRLIPYLADAVPGWFQAVIALYDKNGKELAYADDHYINPDPVMYYEVEEDGEYELEIRDAIYRGREDFVYRITVRDAPWAKKILAKGEKFGDRWTKRAVIPVGMSEKDIIPADVRSLPKAKETPGNESITKAQKIMIPTLLDGSISGPGDVDVFKVSVDKASKLAVETYARRLGSPVDTFVKVTDANGKLIASNDDYVQKYKHLRIDLQGILTHHADSRLVADLPAKGDYYVHVLDSQNSGGPQYGYRLRVSEPMPGFAVIASPSSVAVRMNEDMPITLYVDRRDGYDGAIDFMFDEDSDFYVTGGNIPAGKITSHVTIKTRQKGSGKKLPLDMKAVAFVDGKKIVSGVRAGERVMQAFLNEHLIPEESLSIVVKKEKWGAALVYPIRREHISLKPGASAMLKFEATWVGEKDDKYEVVLEHAPEGIKVDDAPLHPKNNIFKFRILADEDCKPQEANIVASIWISRDRVDKNGNKRTDRWRSHRMPAVSISIIEGDVVAKSQP